MVFKLPRFQFKVPLVEKEGAPTQAFHQWWQEVVQKLELQITTLETAILNIRRINSHTEPTSILSATDNGVTCTVTVLGHKRIYGDGTSVTVIGTATPGLLANTWYGCYYDDTTLSVTNPTFIFTTSLLTAQAAKAAGRHFCGLIKTPVAASAQVIVSGGVYPVGGGTVGGELL